MQNTSNENCEQQHPDNDESRHHEGDDVLLRRKQIIERVSSGLRSLGCLYLNTRSKHQHLKRKFVVVRWRMSLFTGHSWTNMFKTFLSQASVDRYWIMMIKVGLEKLLLLP